jgi:vacuolar-type H+-ATPase subunit H
MKTLLEKVKAVEEEAKQLVDEAERIGHNKLETLTSRKPEILRDVRLSAETEGRLIIKEKLHAIHKEIDDIRRQGLTAAEKINQVATQNQDQAVKKIQEIFKQEYGLL